MKVKVKDCVVAGENIPFGLDLIGVEKITDNIQIHQFCLRDEPDKKQTIKHKFTCDQPIMIEF